MRKHNILTVVALTLLAALGACSRKADTKPLDAAGVRYSVITKLEEMNVSANEVANQGAAQHLQPQHRALAGFRLERQSNY